MKPDAPDAKLAGFWPRAFHAYQTLTGQSAIAWTLIAAANFAFQVVLYFVMARDWGRAGEFGVLNCALGIIGLLVAPLAALQLAVHLYASHPSTPHDAALHLRRSSLIAIDSLSWVWGAICCILILIPLPLPYLPRFSLQLLVMMIVLIALGGVVSHAVCEEVRQLRRWTILLVVAAFARLVLAALVGAFQPWADAGLAVVLVAGFITLGPALRPRDVAWTSRVAACRALLNRDFLVFAGATISVFVGLYLFINGDRMASLRWADFVPANNSVIGMEVPRNRLDSYQLVGLLARGLLWGTQPLLWVLYANRVGLKKTTSASLRAFWIYLAILIVGAFALGLITQPWPGTPLLNFVEKFGPTFAALTLPLGLLQGLGIFALASNRIPECYTLGACGVIYALLLAIFGARPDIMLPLMFGLSLVSIMIVLFVGVTRWGRKQP
jgi:hypothetical protein